MSDKIAMGKLSITASKIAFVVMLLGLVSQDVFAQLYEFSLNQRRRYDQIEVELWGKAISTDALSLGYASLVVEYNSTYLRPATTQEPEFTDSIQSEIDIQNPAVRINSDFHSQYGYSTLGYQNYGPGYYSLEINLSSLGQGGIVPSSDGRGSFLGKLTFDIINSPEDSSKTDIAWSTGTVNGTIVVFDTDSTELTDQINFINTNNFNVIGITILSPNFSSQVVDRDKDYVSLTGKYAEAGYPIYFERSINPDDFLAPSSSSKVIDDDLAYVFDYSLDNGTSWAEFGRVAETEKDATQIGNSARYRDGEISNPNASQTFLITSATGYRLTDTNYRDPVRVLWSKNPYFIERSEEAKLKISLLNGSNLQNISTRTTSSINDISDQQFVLGRLFFLQLNGIDEYLMTEESFSNSTQLTVSAWVNLNGINGAGTEPAIVASSLGAEATEINGSTEGAWMLYLKDGQHPAFRAREILGRGENGYIADLYDVIPLVTESDANPLNDVHSTNWVHIAATVSNNEVVLYVNGEIVEKYTNHEATDIRMLTTNHPIWVGVNPNGTIEADDYLRAGIKEVQIWRTALTQEELRSMIPGVVDPDEVEGYGDIKRGLELYYNFEGGLTDWASDDDWQFGSSVINIYQSGVQSNTSYYRPDQPHIKITAPSMNSGVLNKEGEEFEIRWVSYGLGDIENSGSKDIAIEYSVDNGDSWNFVKDAAATDLGANNAPDVEDSKISWEAWENNNSSADLRSIEPYAHDVLLRIRGVESRTQHNLYDVTEQFTVARFFSFYKNEETVLSIPGDAGMNVTGDNFFIETWMRPYRFPTEGENYMTIISKQDSTTGDEHYSLRLLSTGQLMFSLTDADGVQHLATSDINEPLVRPNSVAIDTAWTHIGVYVFLNGGAGASEIRFYIDGKVQRDAALSGQLGDDVVVNALNEYPTFIGYEPGGAGVNGFIGEIREMRFWQGTPNNTSALGTEPTEMTLYVQGALAVRAYDLTLNEHENLYMAFSLNGRSFVYNGYSRAIGSMTNPSKMLRFHGEPYQFKAAKPYLKLVEPVFKQKVANTKTDLRVRWVGFDYNGEGFMIGGSNIPPALEFSIRGGGGNVIQPYQYIGSKFWDNRQVNSMSFPETDTFLFDKTGQDIYYSTKLNVSKADPDANNDGNFDDQGAIGASLTNARLRVWGTYTINDQVDTLQSEGPLFSITPQTNFTVRVLLEGYHDGTAKGNMVRNLSPTYDLGGIKIKVYTDNAGTLGKLVDSSESTDGYFDKEPDNRNKNGKDFANVNFVFTDLANDDYWVIVDHPNHLPVMSRFPAPFIYEGDEITTWEIESGWDFTSWNGTDENILKAFSYDPYDGFYYTAYGDAYTTVNNPRYSTTGLVLNNGRGGSTKNAMPAMVGGDVTADGQINAADRIRVRLDDGTGLVRSDVTGDGFVNADDRTIVDRNFGKISSIYNVDIPTTEDSEEDPPLLNLSSDTDKWLGWFENNIELINQNKSFKADKSEKSLAGGISYIVRGNAELRGKDSVLLSIVMRNTGADFGLANATFPIEYKTNSLEYIGLMGGDSTIFSNDENSGYARLRSAPTDSAENSLPNVRTIEVDYDAYAKLPGRKMPRNFTYIGTLVFKVKASANSINFSWHESRSVHTTDSMVVTADGNFEDIDGKLLYTAAIQTPNGGESYGAEKDVSIIWNTVAEADIYLEVSTNGGISWTRVNSGVISSKDILYAWRTPKIYSNDYLLRMIDAETGLEVDRSDDKFSIAPSTATLNRPSRFDELYRGGASDSIKWTSKGYNSVRFEFSSDGGTNWISISSIIEAQNSVLKWILPKVTSKDAYVRMIDTETDEEIAISSRFKILNGTMRFRNPKEGSVLYSGKLGAVKWSSSDIAYFDLQLSTNGGGSWGDLDSRVLSIRLSYDWNILAGIQTDRAVLRAIYDGDEEMIYAESQVFSIKSTTSVEDNLPAGIEFGEFYPNPCEKNVNILVKSVNDINVSADIINSAGSVVRTLKNIAITGGSSQVELDLSDMSAGRYYIRFTDGTFSLVKELNKVK